MTSRPKLVGRVVRRCRAGASSSRRGSPAPSSRCSRRATASGRCRSRLRRTSSASVTATSGPNTGGMGAYSPVPRVGDAPASTSSWTRIVEPTVASLRKNDIDYRGVLYAGLMLTPDGPKIIEYNVALR